MASPLHRLLWAPFAAAAVMVACWQFGGPPDRIAFHAVVRGTANPPYFIGGKGTQDEPWSLRTPSRSAGIDRAMTPVIVSLEDDADGYFQSNPHSPVDLAVVFGNMRRLGARHAACGVVLAWEDPEPISLLALENELGKFDSLITAAPLSRGAVPSAVPPAFRRASIPLAEVAGDITMLPVVNRIPVPNLIPGGDGALCGFTHLESENPADHPPMLARWDDRAVFSFAFLAALQRMKVPLEDLEIRLGEHVRLGNTGKIMLIDSYGRLAAGNPTETRGEDAFRKISAATLIDATEDDIDPSWRSVPWILRDDRGLMDAGSRAFSAALRPTVAAITSEAGLANATVFRRLDARLEFLLLGMLWPVLAALVRARQFPRNIGFAVLTSACAGSQMFLASSGVWLPGIAAISGTATAWLLSIRRAPATHELSHAASPGPKQRPMPLPVLEPEPQPVQPARRPAAKKTAAKKAARKRKPKSSS